MACEAYWWSRATCRAPGWRPVRRRGWRDWSDGGARLRHRAGQEDDVRRVANGAGRGSGDGAQRGHGCDRLGADIVDMRFVTALLQARAHEATHPPDTDKSQHRRRHLEPPQALCA